MHDIFYHIKQFIKFYLNPYYWVKPFFLSFVEEMIYDEDYKDFVGGRVEVWTVWSHFDINEYRFFTNKITEFYAIRDKYDFKQLSWWGLRKLKKIINQYNEKI